MKTMNVSFKNHGPGNAESRSSNCTHGHNSSDLNFSSVNFMEKIDTISSNVVTKRSAFGLFKAFLFTLALVLTGIGSSWGQAPGDACASAVALTSPAIGASINTGDQTTCGRVGDFAAGFSSVNTSYGGGEDGVYSMVVPAGGGNYTFSFAASGATYKILSIHSACAPTAANTLGGFVTSSGTSGSWTGNLNAGTVFIVVDTWPSPNCGIFNLTITRNAAIIQPGNNCATAVALTSPAIGASISTGAATTCGRVGDFAAGFSSVSTSYGGGEDGVYSMVVPAGGGNYTFSFAASGATYKILSIHSACAPTVANTLGGFVTSTGTSGSWTGNLNAGTVFIVVDTWPSPNCGIFNLTITRNAVSTITSISPTSGCPGTTMTITGTNLTGATAANVRIGGTPVSSIISNNGTSMDVVVGGGTTGTVTVTTSSTATSSQTFTFSSPAIPVANAASGIGLNTATANWSAAAGATTYFLDVSTSNTFASFVGSYNNLDVGNVTSLSLSGLTVGTAYFYRVRSFNGSCASGNSSTISFNTLVAGDNCSAAIDLATLTSPYSGTTSGSSNDFTNTCASGNTSPDLVFFIDVTNGSTLVIGQTVNGYDSENTLFYGGACPGTTQIACFDDPDVQNISWTNSTGSTQRVYWVQDGYSGASDAGTFTLAWSLTAPPACLAPVSPSGTPLTLTSATVSWTAPSPAPTGGYEYAVTTSATPPASGTATTATSLSVTGLPTNTTYFLHVRSNCGASGFSTWATSSSFRLGYCIPVTSSGCTDGDVVARVVLNTLDNNSGTGCPSGLAGYSDYTSNASLTTTLLPSTTYNCTVFAGQYSQGYAAWIDYNDDGVFDNATERIGFSNGMVTGSGVAGVLGSSAVFPISLACNPPAGPHRLRVRSMYNTNGSAVTPCGPNTYGETEDYTITIAAAPACPAPGLVTTLTPTFTDASITFATGCSAATNYDFEYGPAGFTLGNGTLLSNQTVSISAPNASYTLTGLTAGTNYTVYYRANCGSSQSTWSIANNFSTQAIPVCVSAPTSPANASSLCESGSATTLSWPSVANATVYDVFLNTGSSATTLVSANQAGTSYNAGILPAGNYVWRIVPKNGSTGPSGCSDFTFTINPNLNATVSLAASNSSVCSGENVTFTATPTNGGTVPTYEWRKNGTAIAGASGAIYSGVAGTDFVNSDVITVVMTSNATPCLAGSPATSNSVTMTVNPILNASVSLGASSSSVCPGDNVTFTATPTNGGTAPTYEWRKNGTTIAGVSGDTYAAVEGTDFVSGDIITVVMTSNATPCLAASPATSNGVTMTVNPILTASVSLAANNATVCTGMSATFTATPTNGGTTPTYEWRKNGTAIAGASGATYTAVAGTDFVNSDVITVVMTSNATPCLAGSPATSNNVAMTVNAPVPTNTPGTYVSSVVNHADGTMQEYASNCVAIGRTTDAAGGNVPGNTTMTCRVVPTVESTNAAGWKYLRRSYTSTTASDGQRTLTFYFTQEDFDDYNANNYGSMDLPTSGNNSDPNKPYIRLITVTSNGFTVSASLGNNLTWNGTHWQLTRLVQNVSGATYYVTTQSSCEGVLVNGLAASNISSTNATLTWTAISPNPSTGFYQLRYKPTASSTWVDGGSSNYLATSKTYSTLSPGTQYEFQIRRVCSSDGFGAWSSSVIFSTVSSGCGSPMVFNAPTSTSSSVTLSWPAVTGAAWFQFQYKESSSGTWLSAGTITGTGTTRTVSGLNPNTSYDFRGRSYCPNNVASTWSTVVNASTTGQSGCDLAPNLTVTSTTGTTVTVTWPAVQGAGWYEFRYKQNSSGTWTSGGTSSGSATSRLITGLVPGTNYIIQARTFCPNGTPSSWSSSTTFGTTGAVGCETAPVLTAASVSNTSATITWPAISGAGWFEFRYKASTSSTWISCGTLSGTGTTRVLQGLTANTQYDFQAKTFCPNGSPSSPWSSTLQFTTTGAAAIVLAEGDVIESSEGQTTKEMAINEESGVAVNVFPNPTDDLVHVQVIIERANEALVARVFDMSGRLVQEVQTLSEGGLTTIPLSMGEMMTGVYNVELYQNGALIHRARVQKN